MVDTIDPWRNFYNAPEHFGLAIVDEYREPGLFYAFNMIVVWEDLASARRYWAHDFGCSDRSPFEDYTSREHLREMEDLALTRELFEQMKRMVFRTDVPERPTDRPRFFVE